MSELVPPTTLDDAEESERAERRWAGVAVVIIALLVVMAVFAGLHEAVMPQAQLQTVDPRTLHLRGEFIESNLGSAVEPDGSVTVRLVGQQYSFTPQCIVVPSETPVTSTEETSFGLTQFSAAKTCHVLAAHGDSCIVIAPQADHFAMRDTSAG